MAAASKTPERTRSYIQPRVVNSAEFCQIIGGILTAATTTTTTILNKVKSVKWSH